MELKLNIYDGNGEIVKTYTSSKFTLKTGICEDILNIVDVDKLFSSGLNEQQLGIEIVKIVVKSFDKFKPFLQDIFAGLTDEEYRSTSIKEVAKTIFDVVTYTINELFTVEGQQKN